MRQSPQTLSACTVGDSDTLPRGSDYARRILTLFPKHRMAVRPIHLTVAAAAHERSDTESHAGSVAVVYNCLPFARGTNWPTLYGTWPDRSSRHTHSARVREEYSCLAPTRRGRQKCKEGLFNCALRRSTLPRPRSLRRDMGITQIGVRVNADDNVTEA